MLLCIKIRIPKKIFNLIWYPFFPKKDSTNEPSDIHANATRKIDEKNGLAFEPVHFL